MAKTPKTKCLLKIVYLFKNGKTIKQGDLTQVCKALPKSKVIVNEKGEKERVAIHYEQSFYEQWQHRYTDRIVARLNDTLYNAILDQKTMYYFSQMEEVSVAL